MSDEEPKQQRLILVQGQRVGLGALRHDLIPAYLRWRSDPEVMRGTGQSSQVPTVEAMQAWYEQATRPGNREVHFTIYDLDDVAPVGTALLVRVNQHAGTAEFGLTIGERRNQGLGSEATKLVLDWAFTVMGLHNILLVTFSWNLPRHPGLQQGRIPGDRPAAGSSPHLRPALRPGPHGCCGR